MIPVVASPPPPADQPFVAAALTETEVKVTSGFRGATMVLYGAVYDPTAAPSDVVVVVRGPQRPIRLIRKVRVAGLWLNSRPVVFEGAPGFYMAASTRPLSQIAGFGTLRRLGLGVNHLQFEAPAEERTETRYGVRDVVVSSLGEDYLDWRRAVLRLKARAHLYDVNPRGVTFVDRGLFRAEVVLPAEAPIGRYETQVWLFKDGQPVSVRTREIKVEKVGFERWLYRFAYDMPWLYGLISVAIAVASGWGASAVFRRS